MKIHELEAILREYPANFEIEFIGRFGELSAHNLEFKDNSAHCYSDTINIEFLIK